MTHIDTNIARRDLLAAAVISATIPLAAVAPAIAGPSHLAAAITAYREAITAAAPLDRAWSEAHAVLSPLWVERQEAENAWQGIRLPLIAPELETVLDEHGYATKGSAAHMSEEVFCQMALSFVEEARDRVDRLPEVAVARDRLDRAKAVAEAAEARFGWEALDAALDEADGRRYAARDAVEVAPPRDLREWLEKLDFLAAEQRSSSFSMVDFLRLAAADLAALGVMYDLSPEVAALKRGYRWGPSET